MKSAATVSVSVLASVMVCGCVAASDDDFAQEDTGSIQQAVTPVTGSYVPLTCSSTLLTLNTRLGDISAANAMLKICAGSNSEQYPVIISGASRNIYNNNGSIFQGTKRFWYTVKPNSTAWNDTTSCDYPFIHRFWVDGWKSDRNCLSVGKKYYNDFIATTRANHCQWISNYPAFKTVASNLGKAVASDCSNVLGFDPGTNLQACGVQGWVC
ncbi:MAG: hypothetical protein MUF54_22925 [Polyangiaceae bacterium]|jgi:hypothetical protein|nr:hypothetical protein [Polyangiaceae bacterium]